MQTDSPVRALSWNLEGTRLLTAGALVQLWHLKSQPAEADERERVKFTLGGESTNEADGAQNDEPDKPQGRFLTKILYFNLLAYENIISNTMYLI